MKKNETLVRYDLVSDGNGDTATDHAHGAATTSASVKRTATQINSEHT